MTLDPFHKAMANSGTYHPSLKTAWEGLPFVDVVACAAKAPDPEHRI